MRDKLSKHLSRKRASIQIKRWWLSKTVAGSMGTGISYYR